MRKITSLLVALLALFGTVISARADLIVEPPPTAAPPVTSAPDYTWVIILVIVVVIVAVALLRVFRKK